jgi:hypothetical protein
MKFVFNDIFASDSNLFKSVDKLESNVLPSGLIFEKSIKIASISPQDFNDIIDRYNSGNAKDKADILANEISGLSDEQKEDFARRTSRGKDGRSGDFSVGNEKSLVEKSISNMMEMSDLSGEASEKASRKLQDRNKIVSQLRSILSEEEIGEIFDLIFSKNINESELLVIISDSLQYSLESGTNFKTILSFMINHYDQQRDLNLTRDISKLASEVRAANPDVNIFEMLATSAIGQIPDVAMVSLIDDDKMRNTVLTLISTSQLRVVEQNEAIRRDLQKIRDNLQSIQERTNLQRGLVDAMKMIEVDKTLIDEIDAFGKLFKKYMSDPQYRAFRNVLYQLGAARKLVDIWSTLITDTQPITQRQTDFEMKGKPLGGSDVTQEGGKVDQRNLGRINLNSNHRKFVKLAQSPSKTKIDPEIQKQIIYETVENYVKFLKSFRSLAYQRYSPFVGKVFDSIINNISKSKNDLRILSNLTTNVFNDIKKLSNSRNALGQIDPQTSADVTSIIADAPTVESFNASRQMIEFLMASVANYEVLQGNPQAKQELDLVLNTFAANITRQTNLQAGIGGLPAPSQGFRSQARAFIAANEQEVDNIVGLSREESFARMSLAKKRTEYKTLFENKKEILNKTIKMQVDLGDGSEGETPLETPAKIKSMYEDMAKFLKEVITNVQYEKDLLQKGFDRITARLDRFQTKKVQLKIAEIQADLIFFQNEYGKISSTALIALEMARKQRLLQKLGPIQKKLAAFSKAGFSPGGMMFGYSMTDAGGESQTLGGVLYAMLNEEKKALGILLNAYSEARKSTTPVDVSQYVNSTADRPQDLTV